MSKAFLSGAGLQAYASSLSRGVLYNRFVELEKEVAIPLAQVIKKVLLEKCTGFSFVDSTPLYGYAGTRELIFKRHLKE